MTRICWWLATMLSRMLEPEEWDAVRGDFSESGEPGGQVLRGVLGLVVRRQLALWKDWRPWLALLGVGGLSGVLLSVGVFHFDVALGLRLVGFNNLGLTDQEYAVYFAAGSLALFLWSWTSGFVLGSLSGRATWLTGALFYVIVVNSYWTGLVMHGNIRLGPHPPPLSLIILIRLLLPLRTGVVLLFMLPAYWGITQGRRRRTLRIRQVLFLAVSIAILTGLVSWTQGRSETSLRRSNADSPEIRLLGLALLSWPLGYMSATARWRRGPNQIASDKAVER